MCDRTSHRSQSDEKTHAHSGSQDPESRLCMEDEETLIPVLTQCPALGTIRKEVWGKSVINPLDIQGTRSRRLCGFVRATEMEGY